MAFQPAQHARHWLGRLAQVFYASPLYAFTLRAEVPKRLKRLPPPPWPGNAGRGNEILAGHFVCGGQTLDAESPDWYAEQIGEQALAELHGFGFLDDLAAVGNEAAQERARQLISRWLDAERNWHPIASDPEVCGSRVASWLSHARFISQGPDDALGARILSSLARQARHLGRVAGHGREGIGRFLAIRGLLYAQLCGLGDERRAGAVLKLFRRELRRQILADGGHIDRSPESQLVALAALVDIRDMALDADQPIPDELPATIGQVAAMLRFLRHADGGLALFNGASECSPALIDSVLARSGVKGKAAEAAAQMGYQRLAADRVLLLMDVGTAPPAGFDRQMHAGPLSFEMSCGRERVIVNCGSTPARDPAWRFAQRATAAHSTLVVDDTNASEILENGGIGRRPTGIECTREEDEGNIWVTASHDGYRPLFGVVHQRRLYLSRDGDDLRGEDTLNGSHTGSFALRFHLHPDIQVSIIQNGAAALVRTPSGVAWRLIASGGKLELAETVYLGRRGEARRSEQIVISGPISNGATVKWALRRIGKG